MRTNLELSRASVLMGGGKSTMSHHEFGSMIWNDINVAVDECGGGGRGGKI